MWAADTLGRKCSRMRLTAGFLAGVFSLLALNSGPALATAERVQVEGEIIDTWCYISEIMGGSEAVLGSAHHQCAVWCAAGGIPVLAHPKYGANRKKIVNYLKGKGLCGIEAYYSKHTAQETEKYINWAKELKLVLTGGSDCHGSLEYGSEELMGKPELEYRVLNEVKKVKVRLFKRNISIFSDDT